MKRCSSMQNSEFKIQNGTFHPFHFSFCILNFQLAAMALAWLPGLPAECGQVRVLSISETPETTSSPYYNGVGAYWYVHEYFLSPKTILDDDFAVKQVGWYSADTELKAPDAYKAIILWETPRRITDVRKTDPYFSDLDVISDAAAERLAQFVRDGGVLLVAGGITNYGDGRAPLGAMDTRSGEPRRRYYGFAQSPVAAILPVTIPNGVTLADFGRGGEQAKTIKVAKPDPMLDELGFEQWPFQMYHKVGPKDGAEVLLATSAGEPLLARWSVGKGKVVCVMAAPRGNILAPDAKSPLWPQEAILWDRALRWGLGQPYGDAGHDAALVQRYNAITAHPAKLPQELTEGAFPWVAHVLDAALPMSLRDLSFKYYADLGFTQIVMQGTMLGRPGAGAFLKDYAEGLANNNLVAYLHPDLCAAARERKMDPKDYAQVVQPSGAFALHYDQPYPDPYSAATVQAAVESVAQFMPYVADVKPIRGMFFDDEWAWVMGYRNCYEKEPGIGNYSRAANERYRKLTGQEPPLPVYREPGYVAPENDPWLKWCVVTRQDGYKDYNQAVADAARKIRKDFVMSNYPGGFEGNLDLMIEEVYLDCWKESELEAFERMDVRYNLREDKLRNRYPMWALMGIFRMPEDKSIYPETLRLTTGACLGRGAKGIILWNAANFWSPCMQHPGRGSMDVEVKRLGQYLEKYGGVFPALTKPPSDVWMLSGWFWVNSADNYYFVPPAKLEGFDLERTWWQFQVSDVIGPAAFRAGLPAEWVTEKQLLGSDLFKTKAVILPALLYCREGVVKQLEKYVKRGGTVYVDQGGKVKIEGATTLPINLAAWHNDIAAGKRPVAQPTEELYRKHRAMREAYVEEAIGVLRRQVLPGLAPPVTLDSTQGAWTIMENGDAKYLFVYNSNVDKPNSFQVTLRGLPGCIYDLEAGSLVKPVAGAEGTLRVELPAGGWKVFVCCPEPLKAVKVERAKVKAGQLQLRVRVQGESGGTFNAAVPLKITLRSGLGATVLYRCASHGVLEMTIPLVVQASGLQAVEVESLLGAATDSRSL